MTKSSNKFDLEERTSIFGENIIDLCKLAPKTEVTRPIIIHLLNREQVLGPIIARQMEHLVRKISRTRSLSVKRKQKKQSIG